jgi:hypothetical protein
MWGRVRDGFSGLGWAGRIDALVNVVVVRPRGPIRWLSATSVVLLHCASFYTPVDKIDQPERKIQEAMLSSDSSGTKFCVDSSCCL